ncbi:GCN1-like translational activator [Nosema bombycis CQ1]|uniref:GCN1-like translational activator n=1 Tax=Nosema bombycis (strain CQ1 / CVCC 102059) TaxID=578461 RepID=R0MFR0_NOSB1|nr:GCN1-like translational activator [Nosema bombycis CQ1]|eukprot:EOB11593.1 GCN1-like translational activator [Nosema bombycis CQ1]
MCDTKIQREVTSRIISSNNETINIPNNFLAYAPELTVFQEYLTHFIPILKDMYESDDYDKRKIAFNAFERIIIDDYIIQTALVGMWAIRLNSLDLFMKKMHLEIKNLLVFLS